MVNLEDMLSNAATASQNATLIDCEVTRGALLRELRRWVEHTFDPIYMIREIEQHPDFHK